MSFHNIKVESCIGFDLDKATIICVKMILLKDCINEGYMRGFYFILMQSCKSIIPYSPGCDELIHACTVQEKYSVYCATCS